MAELEEALNSILSDPNAMGQLMDLAGSLGLTGPAPGDCEQQAPPPPSLPDLGQMGALFSALQSSPTGNRETEALLTALRPFLSQDRQRKLDRALKAAGMSRTAKQVLRLWKEGELGV